MKSNRFSLNFSSNRTNLLLLVLVFFLSRFIYSFLLGVRFDVYPVFYFDQFLDPELLQYRLLQSVFYLHSQPPLYNLFLGVVLKSAPVNFLIVFYFVYLFTGLLITIVLFALMTEMRISSWVKNFLIIMFIISPAVIEFENWLFYEYPTVLILISSALFLNRFAFYKRSIDAFLFAFCIALLIYVRGLISIQWFLLILIFVLIFVKRNPKKFILAVSFPFLLVLALYVKNLVIFDTFSINTTSAGWPFSLMLQFALPKESLATLVKEKKIADLYEVPFYSDKWEYYRKHNLEGQDTGIPALDQKNKYQSMWVNCNNLIFLKEAKIFIKDFFKAFTCYPGLILKRGVSNLSKNYLEPAEISRPFYYYRFDKPLADIDLAYRKLFYRAEYDFNYGFLFFWLALIYIYTIWTVFRPLINNSCNSNHVVMIYMTIIMLLIIPVIAFNFTDFGRYRFLIDPFHLILSGLFLTDLSRKTRRAFGHYLRFFKFPNLRRLNSFWRRL